jgi:putative glutamine amidotransferase
VATVKGVVLVSATSAPRAVPYVEALKAGGVAASDIVVVTALTRPQEAGERLAQAAGLVLCGGADIEPQRYGEAPLAGADLSLLPARDELEWQLLETARQRQLPVWGVCRGFQTLNVFLGGSLWQDLPLQRPGAVAHDLGSPPDLLAHELTVLAPRAPLGERLAAAGVRPLVNSRHHQGVRRLAPALLAVAAATDGLIEAAVLHPETPAAATWWVRGVEWHPENLLDLPEQLELWRDFAAALAAYTPRDASAARSETVTALSA